MKSFFVSKKCRRQTLLKWTILRLSLSQGVKLRTGDAQFTDKLCIIISDIGQEEKLILKISYVLFVEKRNFGLAHHLVQPVRNLVSFKFTKLKTDLG